MLGTVGVFPQNAKVDLMNMFSMKPKFDLAAFLAEPAPKGAARSKGARRRNAPFQRSGDTAAPAAKDATVTGETDRPETDPKS
jgi:hypothetical protein